jgi:hypothetical protein
VPTRGGEREIAPVFDYREVRNLLRGSRGDRGIDPNPLDTD